MPSSIIGELILQPILEFLFQVVCYQVGRLTVSVVTLGRVRCDPLMSDKRRHRHRRGSTFYLSPDETSLAGLLILALAAVGAWFVFHGGG